MTSSNTRPGRLSPPLVDLLGLEPGPSGHGFSGRSPEIPGVTRVFGGQVAAQALVAAGRTVAAERRVHSLHSYFLSRGDPDVPLLYEVTGVRDGATYSVRTVMARQAENPVFHLTASFQRPMSGVSHQRPTAPPAPDPESLPDPVELFRRAPDEHTRAWFEMISSRFPLDLRFVGEPPPLAVAAGKEVPPKTLVWLRSSERLPDDPLLHASATVFMSDLFLLASALAPHGYTPGLPHLLIASLDHAVWFHRQFRADEWLLYDQESFWAGEGRAVSRGHIFDRTGALAATAMQEGVIRADRADGSVAR